MQNQSTFTPAGERIAVVDVLRAYALFGIIISHSAAGFLGGRPPGPDFMMFGPADELVRTLERLFSFGKFFTIFSFLFGLSFALQLHSAEQKGAGFAGRFSWRLTVLALIALVHGAFFAGDILIIYVVLGFFLIPLRTVSTKVLLVTALVLILNLPGVILNLARVGAPLPPPAQQQAMQAQTMQDIRQQLEIKQSGPLVEVVRLNLSAGLEGKWRFQIFTGRLWITFGLFLLGMCAGRAQIFRDTQENRGFFRRLFWGAGAVALLTTAIAVLKPMRVMVTSYEEVASAFSFSVQQTSLAAFYVSVVTLLYWRNPVRGLLAKLAPVGKMGLTIYLTQTVFGVLLFYGLGLGMLGAMGVAAAVGCGIAFYLVQIVLARWWMARFSMGPVEWLWRSLTYFKLQPNARPATGPA